MGRKRHKLFISIVTSAVGNIQPSVFQVVNKPFFFVDTAAVFAMQVTGEGFWFSDSIHTAVTLNILDELIDPS